MKPSELLAEPSKWTQGCYARDVDGTTVAIQSPDAVCWCLEGTVFKCENRVANHSKLRRFIYTKHGFHISTWNDAPGRTHAEVLAVLKEIGL